MQPSSDDTPENFYRVSVKALVFDDQNRLMIFVDPHGECEVPGGGWDHAENLEDCVRRELREEAGAEVASIDLRPILYKAKSFEGKPKICVAVRVTLASNKLVPDNDEVGEVRYVTKDELLELPFQAGEEPVKACTDQIWALVEKTGPNQ
ncbi:MAG TPA: NUDIX hydrolase [Patescibacteria group bacterium]|nr:NUDIX hydrolase [Patescibacteria group bacterium]